MKQNKQSSSLKKQILSTKIKRKILIAEDDPGIVDALRMVLEEVGYEVETTVDGKIILAVEKYTPDLLLLDIWMSGIDGREICKQLKSQKKNNHFPIIMISANKDTKQIAKDVHADDYLSKPFQIDDLLKKVAKYTGSTT